ncbi:hypothetical protein J6590_016767 [Homalodisca vitripennis]|nr:hypothetical protein J6590_016767 [Homalodisca vitripennis]
MTSIIPDYKNENDWGLMLARQNALSVMRSTGRKDKRGIIEECCRSPCTVDELREYCNRDEE